MKTKFYKTEHFIYRQWDRGIDDAVIGKITNKVEKLSAKKSLIVAGTNILKNFGIKIRKNENLIIVAKGKNLLTLFFVNDLYQYLKSQNRKTNITIL